MPPVARPVVNRPKLRPGWITIAGKEFADHLLSVRLYVILLVTSRQHAGEGVGAALVQRAIGEARESGVGLLRVDCWAGAERLVQWYEEQGFVPVERFHVGEWEGQLFELRLADSAT